MPFSSFVQNLLTCPGFMPYNMVTLSHTWSHSSPRTIALGSAFIRDGFRCRCHGLSSELNGVSFDSAQGRSFDTSEFRPTKASSVSKRFLLTKLQLRVFCCTQKSPLVRLAQPSGLMRTTLSTFSARPFRTQQLGKAQGDHCTQP